MKKILFVNQSLGIGGAERAQVTLANKLARAGYDVTIVIWLPKFDYQSELDERVRLVYKAPDKHLGNRIPYIRRRFYDDTMWAGRASARQFHRYYVGRRRYDVEIAFFYSWAVKIVSGTPNRRAMRIAWIHQDFRGLSEDNYRRRLELADEYASMDKIVCVSNEARKGYVQAFGDKDNITTIYNLLPIDEIRRKAEEKPEVAVSKARFHIVQVARFDDRTKGQLRMIDAIEKLRADGRDVSLALVGRGEQITMLTDAIKQKNLEDFVSVVDGKTNPYPYIKEADLLVCASYTEGYNLTVAEALILGVPALSTDCAGPIEILDGGKYGMIVENSAEGLIGGISQLYDDPALLAGYAEKAKLRQDFFDEDKLFKQITDLWEKEPPRRR